jgi:hypothetical protein
MVYLHGGTDSLSPSQEIPRLLRNAGVGIFSIGKDPCPSTRFSPFFIVSPILHTRVSFIYHERCRVLTFDSIVSLDGFGGLVVSLLASGSRVRGFEFDRSRWIFFRCEKILSMPSFGGEVK